jgi:hypothetical protein
VHLSLLLPSKLCIFVRCFCYALCSASYFDSLNYASSVHFNSCPQHAISLCVIPLHSSLHIFFVLHIYTICAPYSSSMHSASACSSHVMLLLIGMFTSTPLFLCFSCSSLKKKTASHFCLFLTCYSSLIFISHCAYCWSHAVHTVIFPSLQFNSFFIQNIHPCTVTACFFYTLLPLQLPLKTLEQQCFSH